MQTSILFLLCLFSLVVSVSGYGLYVNCTESVQVGLPVKCSIDSDFPSGRSFDIVFYQTQSTETEVSRQSVTVLDNKITQYKFLDTKGLPGGNYKVVVKYTGPDEPQLRSDSRTLQLVKLIDRSSEITITSPMTQTPDGALRIEGSIYKLGNEGIKIEVRGPDGVVFDNLIATKESAQSGAGVFAKLVTVTRPGDYDVLFTDSKGAIGTKTFKVSAPATQAITAVTPVITIPTREPVTITTIPLSTQTPQLQTTIPTVTISTVPTKSVQALLDEQNKKIDEQNRLIAEQNKKIESQNDLLSQFLSRFKSIFGWN